MTRSMMQRWVAAGWAWWFDGFRGWPTICTRKGVWFTMRPDLPGLPVEPEGDGE